MLRSRITSIQADPCEASPPIYEAQVVRYSLWVSHPQAENEGDPAVARAQYRPREHVCRQMEHGRSIVSQMSWPLRIDHEQARTRKMVRGA